MKELNQSKRLCGAKTRFGRSCRKPALKRKRRCRLHGGLSTGPKSKEGRARIRAAQLKHGRYVDWRERRAKEKAYFRQIRMVMRQAREAGLIQD